MIHHLGILGFDLAKSLWVQLNYELISSVMNLEASRKCSLLALGYALGASFAVLIVGWIWLTIHKHEFWATAVGILVPVAVAIVFAWTRMFLSRSGCQLSDSGVVIHRAFGSMEILYSSISRVDRVRRVAASQSELVRITFRCGIEQKAVNVRPACTKLFAADIVARCPQLKSASAQKIVRDPTFRKADDFMKGKQTYDSAEEWA